MPNNRSEMIRANIIERWQTFVAPRPRSVVLLDVAGPLLLLPVAGIGLLILLLGIPLIESMVYMALKWGNFRRSFIDAFMANLLSTLVGFITLLVSPYIGLGSLFTVLSGFLAVACVLSILIEGASLLRLKRHAAGRTWLVAIAANLVSYAGLFLLSTAR